MDHRPRTAPHAVAVVVVASFVAVVAACTGESNDATGIEAATTVDVGASTDGPDAAATSAPGGSDQPTTQPTTTDATRATDAPIATTAESAAPAATEPPEPPTSATQVEATPEPVPETGVPGLDSDDAFCAAWSRFGGTWQVLLVGSTFLDDPARVASWEVAAASVVLDAYDELLEQLPARLEPERDLLAEGYFGVLARRAEAAAEALSAADPSGSAADPLAGVWLDALASRDPSTPDLVFAVPDDLRDVVADAAARLRAARVPIGADPSMSVAVETPLTDDFIETTCPDQGTLAGGEVG